MPGGPAPHDLLVVGARHEVRPQPARVDLFEVLFLLRGDAQGPPGPRLVHRLAVGGGGQRDELGVLVAALDFQAVHADADEFGHLMQRVEVARREQVAGVPEVAVLAVHEHFVGQSARLGALAPVGAAPAPRFGGKALAGVTDAQRPVHEGFEFHVGLLGDTPDVLEAQFAAQHHPRGPEAPRQLRTLCTGDAHLRGAVNGQIRADVVNQPGDAVVLHDKGVHPRLGEVDNLPLGVTQLAVEDQHVERDEAHDAAFVQAAHHLRERLGLEAHLGPRMEARARAVGPPGLRQGIDPEKHGVGPGFDSGLELGVAADGTHHFRFDGRARHNGSV